MPLPPPPDPGEFAEAAQAGLSGGAGCARLEGRVHQENRALGLVTVGELTVRGTLADGAWRDLEIVEQAWNNQNSMVSTRAGERTYPFVLPFFGRFQGGTSDGGRALFDELMDRMAVPMEIEEVTTAPGGATYLYRRRLASGWSLFRGRQENVVETEHLPGTLQPRAWNVVLEDPVRLEGARLTRLDARLEADDAGRPRAEALETRAALGPFVLNVTRRVAWTVIGECEREADG